MDKNENIFEVIYTSSGKSKNKIGKIYIETSIKGLIYRTNVYLDGFLIDAKEVSCFDLSTLENSNIIFKERYLATHTAFEKQYFIEKVFVKVLSSEGNYVESDGKCVVNTYLFENIIKNEILVDDYEIDTIETEIESEISDDKKAFKLKYSKLHNDLVKENIIIPKFPVNTFLNPILKKFPLYKKNPMHSFYLLIITSSLILWILSFVICGKSFVKIVKKVGGKEASLVVKDIQKSFCIKNKKSAEEDKKELLVDTLYKDGYLIIPKKLDFGENRYIKTIYIKNTIDGDLIVKLNNKVIDNFENPLVTPEMIINVLTPTNIVIKSGGIGQFEFKIENSYLKNYLIADGKYTGRLIFEIVKVNYGKIETKSVTFSFDVSKKEDTK